MKHLALFMLLVVSLTGCSGLQESSTASQSPSIADTMGLEDDKIYEFWHQKAMEKGDAESQYQLGRIYYEGKIVPQDFTQAVVWYRKAADQNHSEAQYNLGRMYSERAECTNKKITQQPSDEEERNYELIATKQEKIQADLKQAFSLYEKAAKKGHTAAQMALAVMYQQGQAVRRDVKKAEDWYEKAAKQGDAEAQFQLGVIYKRDKSFNTSVFWYLKAANQGHARAQNHLGGMYVRGGEGVPQDFEQAVSWYRQAVAQDLPQAQFNLGLMYYEGKGVPIDLDQALVWYSKAAAQGQPQASFMLGVMYLDGEGVSQSNMQSYMWMNLAQKNGEQWAIDTLKYLDSVMTPAEITKAEQMSKVCLESGYTQCK